jgi:Flp pilus assembly protein TadG
MTQLARRAEMVFRVLAGRVVWSRRRRSRGQALVELALITPMLLVLLVGAVDLGRAWQSQITVENAAREGAMEATFSPTSYQADQPCNGPEDEDAGPSGNRVMCRIMNELAGSDLAITPGDVFLSCSAACAPGTTGSPNSVTVEVRGHFSLLTPLASVFTGGSNITLTGRATAVIAMPPAVGAVASQTASSSPSASPNPTPSATPSTSPSPTPSPTATPAATCLAPVANFSVSPTSGKKKKTDFQFNDSSTNMVTPGCNNAWSWNFGDGAGSSTAQNPQYQYQSQDDYTVTLVASNSAGSSTKSLVVHVTP